jgi:tetratricopeptide (TPR) repeat protein
MYYANVTGQLQEAIDTYRLLAQTYPADVTPHVDLALCYGNLGRFEDAVAAAREALRIDPGDAFARSNLSISLMNLNRFDEAKQVNREFFDRKLDGAFVRFRIYQLAFIQGDDAEMARQVAWSRGNPYNESAFEAFEMWTSAYRGQLAASRRHARASVEIATRGGITGTAAVWLGGAALTEAEMGERALALRDAQTAATAVGSWHPRIFALVVFTIINCPTGALARLGIARSYAQAGEKEKSRAAYNNLFVLWKDADPDFPLLLQAKSEFAKLKCSLARRKINARPISFCRAALPSSLPHSRRRCRSRRWSHPPSRLVESMAGSIASPSAATSVARSERPASRREIPVPGQAPDSRKPPSRSPRNTLRA